MGESEIVNRDRLRRYMDREARLWGALVKARRLALKLSLADVAERAGTAPQTVFKIERGTIVARDDLRLALALALRCEPQSLFPTPDYETVLREVVA